MNTMFSIYLKYIPNVDIMLGDAKGELAHLRKYIVLEVSGAGVPLSTTLEAPRQLLWKFLTRVQRWLQPQ